MLTRDLLTSNQSKAIQWGRSHENSALWMPMGHGKTSSGLTIYSDSRNDFDVRRMLVIAPLRVARKVWSDELAVWAHLQGLTIARIIGTPAQRVAAIKTPADIHTINREMVPWLASRFLDSNGKPLMNWPWDLVDLDESQSFNNQESQRWKALVRLRKAFYFRILQQTGTPAPNGYGGLWSAIYLLDQGKRLGTSEDDYKHRYFTPPSGEFAKWILRDTAKEEIQREIGDIVLAFENKDPPNVNNFVRVTLPKEALATYKRMEKHFIAEVKGQRLTAANAGVLDGKLLQLANGAVYLPQVAGQKKEWLEFHGEKIAALEELLEEITGKVLVVYHFQHDLQRIRKVLERSERKSALLRTDAEFSAWAAGAYDTGVLHPASAGHGLNDVYKAGAEDLIHYGLTNNLELYQQVNARMKGGHRGKNLDVMYHHIVADGTRDDDYVKLLKRKAYDQDDLMLSLSRRM